PVKVLVKPVSIIVEKAVDLTSIDELELLTYTVRIENTGEYNLTNIQVSDILTQQGTSDEAISDIGTPVQSGGNAANNTNGILETDETWIYTFSYSVNQNQIDRGADIVNTVSVTTTEGATDDAEATTTITQSPAVTVEKTVDQASIAAPGNLNYTITVENTGNVSLTDVAVADEVTQGAGASESLAATLTDGDTDNDGVLDVGETWTYMVTYAAEQSHIDNGSDIVNTVSVTTTEGATDNAEATTTITRAPTVAVEKTVDQASIAAPGDPNYTIPS